MSALQMTCGQTTCGPSPDLSSAPVLETDRLILREPRLDDAASVAALANNRKIAEMTALIPHPYSIEDAARWLTSLPAETGHWNFAIVERESGKFVGTCGYGKRHDLGPEVGYWIGEPFWGQGLMTEAVDAFVRHIFSATGGDAIYSGAFTENAASLRVQEKVGFVRDGDTTLFSKPRGGELPHVNTVLRRTGS